MAMNQDMEDLMKEAADAVQAPAEDINLGAEAEHQIEVPDVEDESIPSFLDEDASEAISFDAPELAEDDVVPATEPEGLRYEINGKEVVASQEEAIKALKMQKEARKAYVERSKLKRKLSGMEQQLKQADEYRQKWAEVMENADSPISVFEKLTGESFDSIIDKEIERRDMYAHATPEERKILDYENKFKELDRRVQQSEETSRQKEEAAGKQAFNARVDYMRSVIVPAMDHYTTELEKFHPAAANRLGKMLYRETIANLKEAKLAGYSDKQIQNPKYIKRVMQRNYNALVIQNQEAAEKQVQSTLNRRSQDATTKAQLASTENYGGKKQSMKDLVSLNPYELFKRMKK